MLVYEFQFLNFNCICLYKCQIALNEIIVSQGHLTFLLFYSPSSFCLGQNRIIKKPVPLLRDLRCPPDYSHDATGKYKRNVNLGPSTIPHNYWFLWGWSYYLSFSDDEHMLDCWVIYGMF